MHGLPMENRFYDLKYCFVVHGCFQAIATDASIINLNANIDFKIVAQNSFIEPNSMQTFKFDAVKFYPHLHARKFNTALDFFEHALKFGRRFKSLIYGFCGVNHGGMVSTAKLQPNGF